MIVGIQQNLRRMSSVIRPMHVAGSRLVIEGAGALSRVEDESVYSSPEMWITSISPIAASGECWDYLKIFLGDIGEMVPWNANPEEMSGRTTHLVGNP